MIDPRLGAGRVLNSALDRMRLRRAPSRPRQIHFSVTDRCFLPCLHCDIWKNEAVDLPTEVWLGVLDRLAQWVGPASVNFVGGEPLLRRDLEELMAHAVRLGNEVTFNTNGWLVTEKRAAAMAAAGVSIAYVSMDGVRESTVDHSRGRKKSWRYCMKAFDLLDAARGPRVVVTCILNKTNAEEIGELLEFVRDRGYQLVVQPLYQNFGYVKYDPNWWRSSELWPSDMGPIDAAVDLLIEERRRGGPVCNSVGQLAAMKSYFRDPVTFNGLTCKAGHSDLSFDPQGNIRLCYFLEPVATVYDMAPLAAIWDSPRTLRRRHEVSRCERSCNLLNCNFDRDDL
ncbi:MAG TPA: radical SAM protein [Myxococcota bacterium]|nr:radical SAM protein [Myxococcota bacterium]